jgi:DNA-binding response OmpR family regulator
MSFGVQQTILFVSPEPGLRTIVYSLLREEGFRVLLAGDGLAALRLLERHPAISLAITETRTPVLNGWQFAVAARQLHPCLSILRLTTLSEERPIDGLVDLPLLAKPFTILELIGAIRELLKPAPAWPRYAELVGRLRCTPPPRWSTITKPARARPGVPTSTGQALAPTVSVQG